MYLNEAKRIIENAVVNGAIQPDTQECQDARNVLDHMETIGKATQELQRISVKFLGTPAGAGEAAIRNIQVSGFMEGYCCRLQQRQAPQGSST